ncbi:hypothetical protein BpJC7_14530 [Weizmannia acidilactici]|uniref:Uncharacterized protein n=1 Tax=Weizmannia acidilactici TaxID=2607726 RepID=A0A5J4JHY5_9BACI|nr:hypothetical protein BpJC7_14530 [Weizmannia acidilactici]
MERLTFREVQKHQCAKKIETVVLIGSNETKLSTSFNEKYNLVIEKDSVFSYTVLRARKEKTSSASNRRQRKKTNLTEKKNSLMLNRMASMKRN